MIYQHQHVAIINPIGSDADDVLSAYYQTANAGEGMVNLRLVFLTKIDYVQNIEGVLNVKVEFTMDGDVVKTYSARLNKAYTIISADGDIYVAPDDIAIFGNIFTGVPTDVVDGFSVTVTDSTGAVVYAADGSIG